LALQGGYPTIFRHCGNKIEYYDGPRTSDELWKWFKSGCDGLSKKTDINNVGIYNNKIKIDTKIKPKSRNNTNRKSATKKHENIVIIGGKTRRQYPNKKAGCGCGANWFW
jgi:hypothetical protein